MSALASRWSTVVSLVALIPLAGCESGVTEPSTALGSAFNAASDATAGRAGHVAVALANGRVLVAGGASGTARLASAELFDAATGGWSAAPGMAQPRLGHAAVALSDGRVLVAGGHSVDNCVGAPVGNSVELYDPASGTWSSASSMNVPRNSPAALLLADGHVLVAGGGDRCGRVYPFAEIYDPARGTWSMTNRMNVARQAAAAVRLADGRVLVAGGVGAYPFASLSTAELYDPVTGTWTLTGNMNAARQWGSVDVSASAALALLPDGRVLAVGGFDSCWIGCGFTLHASAEIFDPATGTWTLVGPMGQARSHHRLSVLPTGHVLVAGGQAGNAPIGEAEIFDHASGTFVSAGSLLTARYDHSATRLADGRVLIAQGHGPTGVLSSAEIFAFNGAPLAEAGPAVSGHEGAELSFSASGSSDPDGDALTYSWNFGDGSPAVSGMEARHVYADNGSYTVTLSVSDGNFTSTATATATVENVAPRLSYAVSAWGSDGAIRPGDTYSGSGSFSDPGADVWSATVDYGDGSGVKPLALSGRSFWVSHRYATAGIYTVTVTVADDDGASGQASATVRVLSPRDMLGELLDDVQALAASGALNAGAASGLANKLQEVIQKIDRGNLAAAVNQLLSFIQQVGALVRSRQLSAEAGEQLIAGAQQVIAALGGS